MDRRINSTRLCCLTGLHSSLLLESKKKLLDTSLSSRKVAGCLDLLTMKTSFSPPLAISTYYEASSLLANHPNLLATDVDCSSAWESLHRGKDSRTRRCACLEASIIRIRIIRTLPVNILYEVEESKHLSSSSVSGWTPCTNKFCW